MEHNVKGVSGLGSAWVCARVRGTGITFQTLLDARQVCLKAQVNIVATGTSAGACMCAAISLNEGTFAYATGMPGFGGGSSELGFAALGDALDDAPHGSLL